MKTERAPYVFVLFSSIEFVKNWIVHFEVIIIIIIIIIIIFFFFFFFCAETDGITGCTERF